jgi:hypothetical protein
MRIVRSFMKKALPSQDVFHDACDRRAKDRRFDMSLAVCGRLDRMEPVAGGRAACPMPLSTACLVGGHPLCPRPTNHDDLAARRRSQSRLPRPYFTSWRHPDARLNLSPLGYWYYCFGFCRLPDRLLAVIDGTPAKRYGPHVEGADIHRNPTPGPADQKYLYGHTWVTLSLASPRLLVSERMPTLSESRMRENRPSDSMSGRWKRSMVRLLRQRRTIGPETDRPHLNHRATSRLYPLGFPWGARRGG